jgi:hypothetical protein
VTPLASRFPRLTPTLAALAIALVAVGPAAASGWGSTAKPKVKAPKSGSEYDGTHKLVLYISGKSIEIVAFNFRCGHTTGRTSLNDIPLKKTKKGYRFAIKAHGSITFADGRPDENGAVNISGRFGRRAKRVAGHFRVKSPSCGNTGVVAWKAAVKV